MSYLVQIGTQTIGPMSRENVLRQAPNWQNSSFAVSVAPAGTQNFVPLAQFLASAQAVNSSPAPPAGFPSLPTFGQLPHQPQQAQPLPFNAQPLNQPWSQTPSQPQTPLPWQQSAASRTGSASKSSTPFVALAIGGAAVVIVALLLIGRFLNQRKQAELAQQQQVITALQQEQEKQRQEQQRKEEAQQAELQRQEAETIAALDDADTALQAVENEASGAPGDFSDDFRRLRIAVVEARQLVSQGDYRSGQENAVRIKMEIQQARAEITRAIDAARADEEISRAIDALSDSMGAAAQAAAKNKHPATDKENTIQGEWEITRRSDTRVYFTVSFDCRRVGNILGWDHFSVGVVVSGQLEKSGQGWKGYVLGSHVTNDVKM